jgi:hypothetical protein
MYVNAKNIPVATRGEQWRGEFKYDVVDTL